MKRVYLTFILFLCLTITSCTNKDQEAPQNLIDSTAPIAKIINYADYIGNDYLIDANHSYLGFKIKYFGFSPVRGRFNEFNGTLFYNEDDPANLSVSIFIDVSSINTGNERRDNDLKSGGTWFDAETYPMIGFQSMDVIPNADGSFELVGDITIRGITQKDTISFSKPTKVSKDWAGNDQVDFSGRFVLNRQDYKVIGDGFWSSVMENGLTQLSDEVEIELDIHCRRADYIARYAATETTDPRKIVLDRIKFDGINSGISLIDSLHNKKEISKGMMSTIGYTLSAWGDYVDAKKVFLHKEKLFSIEPNTSNQLGITSLMLNDNAASKDFFNKTLVLDSVDSRAIAYQRLIVKLNETQKKN